MTSPVNNLSVTGEPQSDNPTSPYARDEDYVVASGRRQWSDVRDDWTAVINNNVEPSGYVCERG